MIGIAVLVIVCSIVLPLILWAISNVLSDIDFAKKIKKHEEKIRAERSQREELEKLEKVNNAKSSGS